MPESSDVIRTAVVRCLDWPIAAAEFYPDVPVAVVHANRVVATSAAARAEGVARGLRRRQAQARCPQLIVIDRDVDRDARAFEPVMVAIDQFTPRVEVMQPGMCAFATRGPARYFGGEESLAAKVISAVNKCPIGARTISQVGIADGPFAAALAARQSTIVPIGETPKFLAPLKVSVLGQPELAGLLVRLGIKTLGQLADLPFSDVQDRFGPVGVIAHRLARGLDERPLNTRISPPDLTVSVEFDPPIDQVDRIAFAARSVAVELFERLSVTGLACTKVAIEAETEHGESYCRVWRHDGPFTAAALAERVRWQLDGWLSCSSTRDRPTAGVTKLEVIPGEVVVDNGRQLGFWGGATDADRRAARGLARVQGMLGPEAVVTPVTTTGRNPAERVTLVPWGGDRKLVEPKEQPPWPGCIPLPAPALVYLQPALAQVVDRAGEPIEVTRQGIVTAVPNKVSIANGPWQQIKAWAGPWPAIERWWDPSARRKRARLQVVLADDNAHLLTAEAGKWWVEATYD